jgi:hypothetical protein
MAVANLTQRNLPMKHFVKILVALCALTINYALMPDAPAFTTGIETPVVKQVTPLLAGDL